MGPEISEVLPFAVGVAIVPVPIIAVILMLFSRRARVNGPLFLVGWVTGLTAAFAVVYALADAGDVGTDATAADTVAWGKVALGALLVLLAVRSWRRRPAPGAEPELPGWMAGVDSLSPGKVLGLGVVLAAANPKNLILVAGAAVGLAQLGPTTADAVAALLVFVVVGSLSVGGPVAYFFVGGEKATRTLDDLRSWLATHNVAVMVVLLLVFGAVLIANGLAPLTG